MRAAPVAWTASLCLSANVMTEGLVFALTHCGHREGFSEVSVIVMTLILLLRRAPGQLWYRPASSCRAPLVSFSIFCQSVTQLAGHASPPGPEAEPCSWLHIQALCSNPEFMGVGSASGSPHGPKSPLLFLLP